MSPHLRKLRNLKALILNNNQLLEIENIETLLELNTLGKAFFFFVVVVIYFHN